MAAVANLFLSDFDKNAANHVQYSHDPELALKSREEGQKMISKRKVIACLLGFVVVSMGKMTYAAELERLLNDSQFWQSDSRQISVNYPELKFAWNSVDHQSVRVVGTNRLFDLPLAETTFQMREEKPTVLNIVFYNYGDNGAIAKEQFISLISNTQQRVGMWMGTKPTPLTDQLKTTGVRRDGFVWKNSTLETRLTWAYSTKDPTGQFAFRAEYIKLWIAPLNSTFSARSAGQAGVASMSQMKSKIKRDAISGDIMLTGVPMVDQGEKGYCAVASAERVMRFYEMNVDQHELAQLAASSAEGGTDPRNMIESLRRVGVKLGCKVKVVEEFDVQDFIRLIDRYNQAARKRKKPEIKFGSTIDLRKVYDAMNVDILREVRTKSEQDVKHFLDDVTKNIDIAIPILWGVQLGKVSEIPTLSIQGSGGHMRLIIGYNRKTNEILYSDSWGPGHELKRMSLADAWTITSSLYTIEPRR